MTPGFLGLACPEGKHSVQLKYEGSISKLVLFLTSMTSLILLGGLQIFLRQKPLYSKVGVSQ